MVASSDYKGSEKSLPSQCYSHCNFIAHPSDVCGDAGVNKPTALPED